MCKWYKIYRKLSLIILCNPSHTTLRVFFLVSTSLNIFILWYFHVNPTISTLSTLILYLTMISSYHHLQRYKRQFLLGKWSTIFLLTNSHIWQICSRCLCKNTENLYTWKLLVYRIGITVVKGEIANSLFVKLFTNAVCFGYVKMRLQVIRDVIDMTWKHYMDRLLIM